MKSILQYLHTCRQSTGRVPPIALLLAAGFCLYPDSLLSADPPPAKKPDYATGRSRELSPTRVVTYKTAGERRLDLHLFEPQGHQPGDRRPCFLFIHGGGFVAGTPTIMYPLCDYFAKRGWVCSSMRYRFHKPEEGTTIFDSVKDARSAVRYLRKHAAELGIDADKLVAGGRSAGGHLAAATAIFQQINEDGEDFNVSSTPAALVLFSPVIDTSDEGYGQALLGERWRELSPRHQVRAGLPPTIVFYGERDTVTPVVGAKAFAEAMCKANNRCELILHKPGNHSYMMRTEELFVGAMQRAVEFLEEHGIVGSPPLERR